jgi:hypothetical protein
MTFNPSEHTITMERKSKKKDAQGHETWIVAKTEYLPVQWRLYWFRLDNPKGKIDSKSVILDLEKGAAVFETYVEREDGGAARMHGSETQGDWRDYIEKAQTKSLGRALAAVGYGSQFTDDEFNEGERIVDSPVDRNGHVQSDVLTELIGKAKIRAKTLNLAHNKPEWEAFLQETTGQVLQDKDLTLALIARVNDKLTQIERERTVAAK